MKRVGRLFTFLIVWKVLFSVSGEMNAEIMFEFLSKRIDSVLFEARSLQVKLNTLEENVQRHTTAIEQCTKRSVPNHETVEDIKENVEFQALAVWKTITNEKTILRESIKQFNLKYEELLENMKRQMYEFSETVTKDLLSANSSIKATSEEIKSLHDDGRKTEKYIQNLSSNFISESKHLRMDIENVESVLKLEIEQMNMKLQSSIENAKGVDGGWSAWNHWQTCSVTCGTGLQSRRRSCSNPKPQAHGRHCQGDFTDYQLCFEKDCPGGCQLPDDEHRIHPNYDWVKFGWSIADQKIECSSGYKPIISGIITCLEGGRWSQTIECHEIQKTRYRIMVRTGEAWTAGTSVPVYIYLIGEHYSSSKLSMTGFPTRNSELSSTVEAEYITPLRSIKAGRESTIYHDDWQLASVVVNDLTHRQHYIFKIDNPVWVDDVSEVTLPLFASCDQECIDNGGSCLPLHTCKCTPGRHGQSCETRGCLFPEDAPLSHRQNNIFSEGDIISGDDFDCLPSQRPEPPNMTCLKNGSWTKTTRCVDTKVKVRYIVQVKTASDHPRAGAYTNVFVRLHGDNGRTTGEHPVGGMYDNAIGALVEDHFEDVDISPIKSVTVRRQHGDEWRLEYVSLAVDIGDSEKYQSYNSSGVSRPRWIQINMPTEIRLSVVM